MCAISFSALKKLKVVCQSATYSVVSKLIDIRYERKKIMFRRQYGGNTYTEMQT